MGFKAAPLSGGFMLAGLFLALFGLMYLIKYSPNWGLIITVVGGILFLASLVSMTKAPAPRELSLDDTPEERRSRRRIITHKQLVEEERNKQPKSKKAKVISVKKKTTKKKVAKKSTKKKTTKKKTTKKS